MTKDVAQLIKEATAAVKNVPENLQEIAFGKAFDALMERQEGRTPTTSPSKNSGRTTRKPSKSADTDLSGEFNREHLDQLDRTGHPDITHDGTALSNSLRVLLAARDDLGIDGLSASDITHVLVDNFRCKVTRQAVSQALNAAGNYVNRHKEGNAVVFRIMSRGENYLANLDLGESDAGSARKASARKKTSRTKKNSPKPKPTKRAKSKGTTAKKTPGAWAAVATLFENDFFSNPRTIGAIIDHLKHTVGRTYKSTEMPAVLLRYLRDGKLTRKKNADKQYEYTNA